MFWKKKAINLKEEYDRQVSDIDSRIKQGEELIVFLQKGLDALKESKVMLEKAKEYAPII